MIVCREGDDRVFESCQPFNDEATALCTKIEKDFLRLLMGGCSTPISALAQIENDTVVFRGNICSTDGVDLIEVMLQKEVPASKELGEEAARQILTNDRTKHIIENIRNGRG